MLKESDTADEIASIDELLYSMANRVELAQLALERGRKDLAVTVCEDIFYGAQMILDTFCVKNDV